MKKAICSLIAIAMVVLVLPAEASVKDRVVAGAKTFGFGIKKGLLCPVYLLGGALSGTAIGGMAWYHLAGHEGELAKAWGAFKKAKKKVQELPK